MAHKKGVGSSRNGRDSKPKMRGVKKFDGELVTSGTIIVRQCGTKVRLGTNVGLGRDFTIFALTEGTVKFGWARKNQKNVSIIPVPMEA